VSDTPHPENLRVRERGPLSRSAGPNLYYRWAPARASRGTVLILHGFGEHSGRYEHVMGHLCGAGFSALAIDYRGWGLAEGKRGCLRRFEDYVADALSGLDLARDKLQPDEPLFLLGHSQGGLLAARTAMEEGTDLAGLILSSPGLGVGMEVPLFKRMLASLASRVLPDLSLPSGIPTEWLTADPEMASRANADPLVVRNGTARWLVETYRTQNLVEGGAASITVPTLILVAGDERLVSTEATRSFHDRLGTGDRTWIDYPGLRHELFNELGRAQVLADLAAWVADRS